MMKAITLALALLAVCLSTVSAQGKYKRADINAIFSLLLQVSQIFYYSDCTYVRVYFKKPV